MTTCLTLDFIITLLTFLGKVKWGNVSWGLPLFYTYTLVPFNTAFTEN